MPKSDISVLRVLRKGFEDTRGQILCQLCNLPSSVHSYPGNQTNVGQSIQLTMYCI